MIITFEQAKQIMPQARTQLLEQFVDLFNELLPLYEINTPLRIAIFMAQGAHESGELRELVENMYYTTPERLMAVWPKRFLTLESALPYVKSPESLGNFVYANKLGNGDSSTGDGFKYRGRGWFNGTGKEFYQEMTNLTKHDFINKPEDLAMPRFAVLSACEEWKSKKLNKFADEDDFKEITRKINGKCIGLNSRFEYYYKAKIAFKIEK